MRINFQEQLQQPGSNGCLQLTPQIVTLIVSRLPPFGMNLCGKSLFACEKSSAPVPHEHIRSNSQLFPKAKIPFSM